MRPPLDGAKTLAEQLVGHHRRIEEQFERILAVPAGGGAPAATAALWIDFDLRLRAHLELEESMLVSILFRSSPRDATAIVTEHQHIRTRLGELHGAAVANAFRADIGRSFLHELRAHGRREEAVLYRWADENLDDSAKRSIETALRQTEALFERGALRNEPGRIE